MLYKPTIGLEIHAELKTRTKMFCNSKNDPEERRPNVNICPVCMGHPGTLPVINREAVRHVLKIGIAVGGKISDYTEFDRKNYFYPDLPKGYQISQYKYPLVRGGRIADILIERVHLEEDTARSIHPGGNYSLVDFNRAGVPLMELVTEPVLESAEQAIFFAREFQLLLRYVGVSDANMEKGEMRVEANVSIRPNDNNSSALGVKVEVKNLNSFKAVEKAIAYEIKRQSGLLEKGEKVVQETRGWDENKDKTFSQRTKEESHDYRYFPDPDLPSLTLSEISEFDHGVLKKELPELPWQRRERYRKEYGIKDEDVESYVQNTALGMFFEDVTGELNNEKEAVKLASNYILSDIIGILKKEEVFHISPDTLGKLTPHNLGKLVKMIKNGEVSSRGAKDILAVMVRNGGNPPEIAKEKDLLQKSDEGELNKIVSKIIKENSKVAADFKGGKEQALQFLIGQGMGATRGSANPEILKKLFIKALSK